MTIAQRALGSPWRLGLAHARAQHMLIWVTRGSGRCVVEGRASAMSAHNALFVQAGTLFSFTWEPSCFGQTVLLPPSAGLDWPDEPLLLRVREPQAQLTLTHYIEAIHNEASSDALMSQAAASAHAQLMMVWAHRYRSQPTKMNAARRLMRAFCALIVQSETKAQAPASMADYAAQLGVTPTHLTRVCKSECASTAADLLTQHSLQRACRYLEDDALKAVDIAKRLNFSTPAYFTNFIKTHTGQTPSALRAAAKASRV
ncbi:MAG: AraC family transcriptional regulator [Planktotalea sp.]